MPLEKVSTNLYLDDPTASPSSGGELKATDPTVVVCFAWMDGALPHVKKYTDHYRKIFPLTPLILLLTPSSTFMRRHSTNMKALKPAYHLISSRASPSPSTLSSSSSSSTLVNSPSPRILVHTFSNGGCISMQYIDEIYKKEHGPKSGFPAKAIVSDSAPGTASDLRGTIRAFSAPFDKKPVLKVGVSVLIGVFFGFLKLIGTIVRRPSPITLMSNYLLHNFPQPRLFLYSPTDLLIPSNQIEEHAASLKAKDVDVEMCKFEGTGHVGHVRGEENRLRYWKAVEGFWGRVVGGEPGEGEGEGKGKKEENGKS